MQYFIFWFYKSRRVVRFPKNIMKIIYKSKGIFLIIVLILVFIILFCLHSICLWQYCKKKIKETDKLKPINPYKIKYKLENFLIKESKNYIKYIILRYF